MDSAEWDDRYRSSTALWSGKPNPQLAAEVRSLEPGRALDCGCGEGADAVWLAEAGWEVTAVDFSTVALQRASVHAADRGDMVAGRISFVQQDLTTWDPPVRHFDLVSAQFLHLPAEQRKQLHRRLAEAVAPGGHLLVVGHHPMDLELDVGRPARENLFDGDEILHTLDADREDSPWTVVTNEARPRDGRDAEGGSVTLADTVVTLRREP